LPKPVVAGVHGAVAGAGWAFLLNADVVVAARSTRFRLAYSGIGLTAEQAREWDCWPRSSPTTTSARVDELAEALAGGPASAVGQAKRLVRSSFDVSRENSAADETRTIAAAVSGREARELIRQFTEPGKGSTDSNPK
jgi:2-(1,2-epoxy-1,2-dihydrophenyl)acetyl-CoA isomerase